MPYILALDQGTTSSRSLIFDEHGAIIATAQKEFKQFFPKPGLVEQDPMEIWSSQLSTMVEVIAKARIHPDEIKAIGITNQRETTIVWDKHSGVPIYPAIVWQDRRTISFCEELKKKGLKEFIHKKTGLLIDPYFSASKIHWILENVPGAKEKAKKGDLLFGTVDTWLIYQLTNKTVHATDPSNASRTMLYDLNTHRFDEELLKIFAIPKTLLPEIKPSSGLFGYANISIFPHQIPITGVAGDQQAALFGQGCFDKGMLKTTYGTGCFILMNLGEKVQLSKHEMLTTVAWQIGDKVTYALEGSVFVGGAAVQWVKDNLGIIKTAKEIEELAGSVTSTEGVLFIPALTGLGAPHWDPSAKGAIFGITRGTKAAHIALATLQGIAFLVYEVIEAMKQDSDLPLSIMRVDGKVARSDLLLQFQADLLKIAIERPTSSEMTALGAALLAGLGASIFPSIESLKKISPIEKTFHADHALELEELKNRYHKAVELIKELDKHHDESK
jgi:glycerol kinase